MYGCDIYIRIPPSFYFIKIHLPFTRGASQRTGNVPLHPVFLSFLGGLIFAKAVTLERKR